MRQPAVPISPETPHLARRRTTCAVVLALAALAALAAVVPAALASETQKKGILARLSDPPLPAELTEDVDVFHVAKVRSTRSPLTFKPYRVAKMKRGWMRSRSDVGAVAVDARSSAGVGKMRARQNYSFLMHENDQPEWFVGCKWEASKGAIVYSGRSTSIESPTTGAVYLECDIGKPDDTPLWGVVLVADHDWRRGLAGSNKAAGELLGPVSRYAIRLLYAVEGSRILGDLPGGYLFFDGDRAIAAMQMAGGDVPVRFTISRSVPAEERSVIAAAAAALSLQEQMPDFDP